MERLQKQLMLREVLSDIREDMGDDEIIELLFESRVSCAEAEGDTLGQRAADRVARFAGSWVFVIGFVAVLILWTSLNVITGARAFDPYPFILLNLLLSCVAALQAPLIMMSQNRQSEKDRARAKNDYRVNLKNEIVLLDIHTKLLQISAELLKEK